jgi:hypothetical protein
VMLSCAKVNEKQERKRTRVRRRDKRDFGIGGSFQLSTQLQM